MIPIALEVGSGSESAANSTDDSAEYDDEGGALDIVEEGVSTQQTFDHKQSTEGGVLPSPTHRFATSH